MEIPKVVQELIEAGVEVTIKYENSKYHYYLDGFYKENGYVFLSVEYFDIHNLTGTLFVSGRYEHNEKVIENLEDIVRYNHQKWQSNKARGVDAWLEPDEAWIRLLLKFNLIEVVTEKKIISKVI